MNSKERIILFLLAAVNFTHIMDFMIMMPLSTHLIPVFHINPFQFSIVVSAYTYSAFASGLIAAFFVDKFDRKKVLVFAYTGFLIGTLACALAPNYTLLVTARVVAGLFGGVMGAQVLSIVADLIPFERRATAMGTITAAFGFASVIGVPLGLYLAAKITWHTPFYFVCILGSIILALVIVYIPKMDKHIAQSNSGKTFEAFSMIITNQNQRKALTLMMIMMFGHFCIIPYIAQYMEFNVGFTKEQISYIYLSGGIAALITAPVVGKLADKYGKYKVFSIFVLLCLLPIFFITNMPRIPYYYVLIVAFFFFAFTTARFIPVQAIVSSVVSPQQRGSFMSINSSMQQLSSGTAALVAGLIVSETPQHELLNYHFVGYMAMAFSLACLFLVRRVKPLEGVLK